MPTTVVVVDPVNDQGDAVPWRTLRLTRSFNPDDVTVDVDYDETQPPAPAASGDSVKLTKALARLGQIADKAAKAPGSSSDKTKQIAALHALANGPL